VNVNQSNSTRERKSKAETNENENVGEIQIENKTWHNGAKNKKKKMIEIRRKKFFSIK